MLRERSIELERDVLARFPGHAGPVLREGVAFADAVTRTRELLAAGGPAIARPALSSADGTRTSTPGLVYWAEGEPVVVEIRLALRPRGRRDLALQLAHHAALIEEMLGRPPLRCEVINGRGETFVVEPEARDRYTAEVARAVALLGGAPEPETLQGHSFCQDCSFYAHCWDRAERARRVEVLPGLVRHGADLLRSRGIRTFDALAALDATALAGTPLEGGGERLLAQARAHAGGGAVWLDAPRLPRDRTPVWLDVEGDAMGEASDIPIYLWGLAVEPVTGRPEPESHFAEFGEGGDRQGWDRFVARAEAILAAHPDVVWVHWDDSEPLWLRRYIKRHGAPVTLEHHWQAKRSFVDLHAVLERCVRLPLRSYSIKWVAPFAGFEWRNAEAGSEWSVAQFHRAKATTDPAERQRLLAAVAEYNVDDLLAMRAVWRWIEAHGPRD